MTFRATSPRADSAGTVYVAPHSVPARIRILFAVLLLSACTEPNHARQALEDAGYTDVRTGGYSWFGCGKDDNFATEFTATAPSGRCVRGAVCAGIFKGETIRTFGRCEP